MLKIKQYCEIFIVSILFIFLIFLFIDFNENWQNNQKENLIEYSKKLNKNNYDTLSDEIRKIDEIDNCYLKSIITKCKILEVEEGNYILRYEISFDEYKLLRYYIFRKENQSNSFWLYFSIPILLIIFLCYLVLRINDFREKNQSTAEKIKNKEIEMKSQVKNIKKLKQEFQENKKDLNYLQKINNLEMSIKNTENRFIELKASFFGYGEKYKNNKLQRRCIETICAFLNSEGGKLIIGVEEKGENYKKYNNLSEDLKKYENDYDKLKLSINNIIKSKIGNNYLDFIEYEFIKINNNENLILMINIKKCDESCYIKNNENKSLFLKRIDGENIPLEGKDLEKYLKKRFN